MLTPEACARVFLRFPRVDVRPISGLRADMAVLVEVTAVAAATAIPMTAAAAALAAAAKATPVTAVAAAVLMEAATAVLVTI